MRVALVTKPQHESLASLLCELHVHYDPGTSVSRADVRLYLEECLVAKESPLRLVVASRDDGLVVGFAALSLTYSLVDPAPETRRQCALKELYVTSSARNLGVGSEIMAWVARYAADHGCSRIDWPVRAGNSQGIAFYERLGAKLVAERLSYRLSGSEMLTLASKSGGADAGAG